SPSTALRINSDLDEGAVLMGVPVPSIYYRNWYAFLMLDRLIQEIVKQKPAALLVPSLESYYYRLRIPVPSGQSADSVEADFRKQLEQFQYIPATAAQLESARHSAIQHLESEPMQQWFLSLGVPERRME